MGGIDLHTHTLYSDGTFTPRALLELARDRGLETVAVTDHDSTMGITEAFDAGHALGIEVIPGTELSTIHRGEGVHLLCYLMDLGHTDLVAELQRLRDDRFSCGEGMVVKL